MGKKSDAFQKLITAAITLTSGSALGIYLLTKYNTKKQLRIDEDENTKDTSRPQNPNFGMAWGAQADTLLMEEFDTGDLVLVNYECKNMPSVKEMINCYNDKFKYIRKYDSFGVVIRSKKDLKVLVNHFGQPILMDYAEFVSRIYNGLIVAQKLEVNPDAKFTKEELEAKLYNKGIHILHDFDSFENGFKKSQMNLTTFVMDSFGLIDKALYQPVDISALLTNKRFKPEFSYQNAYVIRQNKDYK